MRLRAKLAWIQVFGVFQLDRLVGALCAVFLIGIISGNGFALIAILFGGAVIFIVRWYARLTEAQLELAQIQALKRATEPMN
jgi:hypothetical protein